MCAHHAGSSYGTGHTFVLILDEKKNVFKQEVRSTRLRFPRKSLRFEPPSSDELTRGLNLYVSRHPTHAEYKADPGAKKVCVQRVRDVAHSTGTPTPSCLLLQRPAPPNEDAQPPPDKRHRKGAKGKGKEGRKTGKVNPAHKGRNKVGSLVFVRVSISTSGSTPTITAACPPHPQHPLTHQHAHPPRALPRTALLGVQERGRQHGPLLSQKAWQR